MASSHESAPQQPNPVVEDKMRTDGNNDIYRNFNYRGRTDELKKGSPRFGFTNPAYRIDTNDEYVAMDAPNSYVELANLQNRRDDDEKAATLERIDEIGNPGLNLLRRRELGKLADRLAVIDPNGDMNERHRQFKEANLDALMENAQADAAKVDAERILEKSNPKVEALANVFHEIWLRTRNKTTNGAIWSNGEREPREKKTKDESWTEKNGKEIVDIANTGFIDLPEDWKAENEAAAEVIVDLIASLGGAENINLNDPETYAKCGSVIHDRWLERNTYAKGGELDVDFDELPVEEQVKDLEQLNIALELFVPEKDGVPERPFETRALQTVNNWALERWLPMRSVKGDLITSESDYYQDQRAALLSGRR